MSEQTSNPANAGEVPWQMQMYRKSLKKRQKVELLSKLMGPSAGKRCVMISGHDNNGAMNYEFRAGGGTWTWGQVYDDGIAEMSEFLGDPVAHIDINKFPWPDNSFDVLIIIDVHEHFSDLDGFNREIARVVAPGGMAIVTTPNGNTSLPVAFVKRHVGMGPRQSIVQQRLDDEDVAGAVLRAAADGGDDGRGDAAHFIHAQDGWGWNQCQTAVSFLSCMPECHGGTRTCVQANWGPCAGEVLPVAEVCDQLLDDSGGVTALAQPRGQLAAGVIAARQQRDGGPLSRRAIARVGSRRAPRRSFPQARHAASRAGAWRGSALRFPGQSSDGS